MTILDENRIRARAHEIWEREGRPEGRNEVHWAMAIEELAHHGDVERVEIETVDAVDPHTRLAEVHILPPGWGADQEDRS